MKGPVQRRLGLASVRLDVAGKMVTASIQDRDAAEARDILRRLPDLARDARTMPGPAARRLARRKLRLVAGHSAGNMS